MNDVTVRDFAIQELVNIISQTHVFIDAHFNCDWGLESRLSEVDHARGVQLRR
jgi:hypothetical protein